MNLNKKILFSTIIIVVFIMTIVIGTFFYWPEEQIPSDTSQETDKAECLENMSKMTDEQIIERINVLPFTTDEEMDEIRENMKDYLVCNFKNDREKLSKPIDAILYDKTLMLLKQLKLEKFIEILWPVDPPSVSISNVLAFESIESICLDNNEEKTEFLEMCLKITEDMKDKLSPEEIKEMANNCKNTCDFINKYTNDISFFENDYLKETTWVNNESVLIKQIFVRIALSFRLGSRDLALKICNYVPTPELKEDCEKYVDSLDYIKNCKRFDYGRTKECMYKECIKIRQAIINLICELEKEK